MSLCASTPPQSCGESDFGPDRGRRAPTGSLLLTLTAPRDLACGLLCWFPQLTSGLWTHTNALLSRALIPLEIRSCLPKNTQRYTWKSRHMQAWQTCWMKSVMMCKCCMNSQYENTAESPIWSFVYPTPTCILWLCILPGRIQSTQVAPTEGN